jgi:hypothetical protein
MDFGTEVMDGIKSMVEAKGNPIHMGSEYCKQYKAEHGNCVGCESEKGCNKVVNIMLLMVQSATYTPKNFKDSIDTHEYASKKIAEILES